MGSHLEIKTQNQNYSELNFNLTTKADGFIIVQKMTNSGEFIGDLNTNFGLIKSIRISFPDGSKNWILITDITFTV